LEARKGAFEPVFTNASFVVAFLGSVDVYAANAIG